MGVSKPQCECGYQSRCLCSPGPARAASLIRLLAAASLLLTATAQDLHDHHATEVCACAAAEADHLFSLDCTDTAAIAASETTLGGCPNTDAGCSDAVEADGTMPCKGAFFHLYYAKKWCGETVITASQEALVHTYEDACTACEVSRPYDATVSDCAQPTCTDAATGEAAAAVLDAACTPDGGDGTCCSTPDLVTAWQIVIAYHDLCEEDEVPASVENAMHEYAHACESSMCNTAAADYDGTVCPAPAPAPDLHDHHAHEVCACAAAEADHPFSTDCTDTAAIAASETTLGGCPNTDAGCDDYVSSGAICR